jgi:hypothetical protein
MQAGCNKATQLAVHLLFYITFFPEIAKKHRLSLSVGVRLTRVALAHQLLSPRPLLWLLTVLHSTVLIDVVVAATTYLCLRSALLGANADFVAAAVPSFPLH